MGNKKKKKNGRQSAGSVPARQTRSQGNNPYAKYAGAVSNKSKRNYADLRLVRPAEISGRAEAPGARRKTEPSVPLRPAGGADKASGTGKAKPSGRRKDTSAAKPGRKANASGAPAKTGGKRQPSRAAEASASRKKPSRQAASAGKRPVREDDYTRALNNEDFYGDLVEKYYLKYPEKQEERKSPPGSAAARSKKGTRAVRPSPAEALKRVTQAAQRPSAPTGEKQQSIAALAAKNRSAARGRQFAGKLLHSKAKGSVPVGTVHRKVRRTNRRRSLFLYGASAASVAAVLGFLFFFWGFKVKRIVVAGETPYSAERITGLCAFSKGDNLMFIDTAVSEQQVVDTLPYVEQCEIRRAIPNSVEVKVKGASPLGVAETGSGCWVIVSTSGKILESISNVAFISDSDLGITYEPSAHTVDDVAAARNLPVLTGLTFEKETVGGYADEASAAYVGVFECIRRCADAREMRFTRLRHTDRGYEADLEGRINLVLGETDSEAVIDRRLCVTHNIVYERGEIGEHEKGEMTYLKNQVFFSPSYDVSEEELERYEEKHARDGEVVTNLGASLLEKGVDVIQPEDNG